MPETNHCRREGGRKDAAPDPIHEIVSLRCSPDADRDAFRRAGVADQPATRGSGADRSSMTTRGRIANTLMKALGKRGRPDMAEPLQF